MAKRNAQLRLQRIVEERGLEVGVVVERHLYRKLTPPANAKNTSASSKHLTSLHTRIHLNLASPRARFRAKSRHQTFV